MALITHPNLAQRLTKEQSYTSTPPLGLCVLFCGEIYLLWSCDIWMWFLVTQRNVVPSKGWEPNNDTATRPWKTWILKPKVHYHVHTSLLLVLKENMFWKLDLSPFSGNMLERHLHTQLWQKKLFLFIGQHRSQLLLCVYQALGFVSRRFWNIYIYFFNMRCSWESWRLVILTCSRTVITGTLAELFSCCTSNLK